MSAGEFAFRAVIEDPGSGGAFVRIPFDVEQVFGAKRVKIKASIDGEAYRGTLVRMGEPCHILIILKHIREKIGKNIGDQVEVIIEEDLEPRLVEIPPDLRQLFEQNPLAEQFFDGLSYTNRKEYVTWIISAKQAATRQECLAKTIQLLLQNKRNR